MKLLRPKTIKFFCAAAIFCAVAGGVFGERPPFKIYTTQEGLAHDSVNKIVRDSRGFLWFCTAEGLSRFDGSRFVNFTQDEGLPNRNITDFLETRSGTILVGTSFGVVVFNPNGRAYRWNVLESKLEQTSDEPPMFQTFAPEADNRERKHVLSLAEDADGGVWAGTALGLYRLQKIGDDWRFEKFKIEDDADMNFNQLLPDSKGGLIVVSSGGLYRIFRGGVEKFSDKGAYSAIEDKGGRIWIGSGGENLGLRIFEFDGDGHLRETQSYTKRDGLIDDSHFRALIETSDGRIYAGGDFAGLSEFTPEAKTGEPKFRLLSRDNISALGEDAAGNLWLGTALKGAWKLAQSGFFTFGEREGISESDDISSIRAGRSGEIFLTVTPNKILRLAADGKFEAIVPRGLKARSWGWHFLDFESQNGEWWIPAADGLYRYPKTQTVSDLARTAPKRIYKMTDGFPSSEFFNVFEDSRGDVWTVNIGNVADTLSRWERATDKFYFYTTEDGLPKQNGALAFAEDFQGDVWLGHYFGKLARWRNGKFQTFTAENNLPESQIDDLLVDSIGRLWIATTGRGVFLVDDTSAEQPEFKSVSTQNGLSSNQIICFTEDRFGQIYIGTGRGINRIDRQGGIKIFTQADGLPSNFVTRCAADANGFLWFVSRNALVRYQPEIERSIASPTAYIDKISVAGVPQKISALGETEINLPEFSSDQHQVQIDFFALAFGAGENVRYQYRLDGQDWSSPTEQQTVNLDLSSGKHDFAVRAVLSDGAAGGRAATVAFKILSPVWARPWFVALTIALVAAIIFLFYRYRTARLREVNHALEEAKAAEEALSKSRAERIAELERVRTRIATDLHDDIGSSLTQIAVLSEVAQAQGGNGNGAAAKPLKMISSVSNELVETMSDIVWSINPKKDHLSDLTQRMRRFASDVLSARAIRLHFDAAGADEKFVINTNLRREAFLIFKELVNNVVKHSGAKNVSIHLEISGERLTLEIRDDGCGFDASNLDPRETTDSQFAALNPKTMGGNGVRSVWRRAGEMRGELIFDSQPNRGTTAILILPLDAAAQTGGDA